MLRKRLSIILTLMLSTLNLQSPAYGWENANFTVASFGGTGNDVPNAITTDSSGNTYIGGYFSGTTDFNPSSAIDSATSNGQADGFISKYSSSGSLIWAKSFGGTSDDQVVAIAMDSNDNLYITGVFVGAVDFDYTTGVESITASGSGNDIFVSKISSSGERLWTKTLGGPNVSDTAYAIAVDSSDNVIIGGDFRGSVDFDPGSGSTTVNNATAYTDLFVLKLSTSGEFIWARTVTNSQSNDQVQGLSTFPNGDLAIVGGFGANSTPADFDPGVASFTMSAGSVNHNIFIWKLNSDGSFGWAKNIGNSATADRAYAVAVDSNSNVYTTGTFQSVASFSPAGDTLTATSYDGFVTKHDSSGAFQWVKQIAGNSFEYGRGISVDLSSNVFVTGYFYGNVDLDVGPSEILSTTAGLYDFFAIKLNSAGGFQWGKTFGSTQNEIFITSRVDSQGNFLSAGYIGAAFSISSGSNELSVPLMGAVDGFYLCLTSAGNYSCGVSVSVSSTSSEEQDRKSREERARIIAKARNEVTAILTSGKPLTKESLSSADYLGVTDKNLSLINEEVEKLSKTESVDLTKLGKIIKKYEVLGRVEAKGNVYYSDLVESGLVAKLSPYRTMIMIKLRKLPKESIDSEAELKAALAAIEENYVNRNKRLKETIERINSRGK